MYVVVAVVDESFSLIYQLPDKITRWIGGHKISRMLHKPQLKLQGATGAGDKVGSGASRWEHPAWAWVPRS